MKGIPSSVISTAINDTDSSMKESSTKMAFYKHMHARRQDIYAYYFRILRSLEFGIFVKKPWDLESCTEI